MKPCSIKIVLICTEIVKIYMSISSYIYIIKHKYKCPSKKIIGGKNDET